MGRHTTGSVTPSSGGPGERFGVCASADDANSARGRSFCHWIWRGLFMMLLRDFREPAQPFCSDRRSNYDRSRGAVSRFLADSWPRLGHSTARRQIAGREVCHSPRRISCGARFVPKISGAIAHFRLLWALRGSWLVSNPCLPLGFWFRACEANPLGDADIRSASVR